MSRSWMQGPRAYLVPTIAVGLLGAVCIARVLALSGEPALPLDDSFIHLQYARRLAEGSFFGYVPGEGYTTGATSWLWPLAIAPFWAAGARDLEAVWIVWALGALAYVGVVVETTRVAAGLCGRWGGLFAGALCTLFGAFAWFAFSGMETVPLAWLLMRTVRVGAELCEARQPSAARRVELALLGLLGPLLRPEGALATLIAVAASLVSRPAARGRDGARARPGPWVRLGRVLGVVVPLAGPAIIPLTHLGLAGHASSSTAQTKWLVLDPYLDGRGLAEMVLAQVRFLVTDLLQGNPWTTIFLPDGFGLLLLLGLAATLLAAYRLDWVWLGPPSVGAAPGMDGACAAPDGRRGGRPWRVAFVWVVALGTLIPCSYATLLWNRVRYIWPFAPAWFVAVTCLGCAIGALAARLRPSLGACGPALLGGLLGAFASKLPWSIEDLAQSAYAISRQQVDLARSAALLPPEARIGVNDTGAIAYLSGRRTFDVVGLTTESETRYWTAGAGSRFEHYERLGPAKLPSHFFVYPEWLQCPAVLGRELTRATVLEQTILGGVSMVAYETRHDLLGSGSRPFAARRWGELLDELDVADLESEQAHGYAVLPARASDDVVGMWPTPEGRVVADGGRRQRWADRFVLRRRTGERALLVMRVDSPAPLEIWLDGARLSTEDEVAARAEPWAWEPFDQSERSGSAGPAPTPWVERVVALPASSRDAAEIVVRAPDGTTFGSYHYWCFAP